MTRSTLKPLRHSLNKRPLQSPSVQLYNGLFDFSFEGNKTYILEC